MALTATASKATRREVICTLGMTKPVTISICPEKRNIVYYVNEKNGEVEEIFQYLVEELQSNRTETDKTIIFCRTYKDCSNLYLFFKDSLKEEITDPVGYPNISQFRLVDMFTACNTSGIKNSILRSFTNPNGRLRIIIATVAFGMGIDCPNVRRIIHWGPPSDIETYIQETGRGGRDGNITVACLYYSRRDLSLQFMEPEIVSYCKNVELCRRAVLFKDFDYCSKERPVGCSCCDLCLLVCDCDNCKF